MLILFAPLRPSSQIRPIDESTVSSVGASVGSKDGSRQAGAVIESFAEVVCLLSGSLWEIEKTSGTYHWQGLTPPPLLTVCPGCLLLHHRTD